MQPGIDFSLCICNWRVQRGGSARVGTGHPIPCKLGSRAGCDPVSSTSRLYQLERVMSGRVTPPWGPSTQNDPNSTLLLPLSLLPAVSVTLPGPAPSVGDWQRGISAAGAGNMHFRRISRRGTATCWDGDTMHLAQPFQASPQCRERGTAFWKCNCMLP